MSRKILPLKDQVVFVTDSNRGLGRVIALAFARQGVRGLVINCLNHSETLDDLLTQVNLHSTRVVVVKTDITNANDVERLFETSKHNFGYPITTVVNNAFPPCSFHNGNEWRTIEALEWDAFDVQFRGNVQGAINTTKAALLGMREIGFGRIINLSTGAKPLHEAMACRGALLAFTNTTAAELSPLNITVNLIACSLPCQADPKWATVSGDSASKMRCHRSVTLEEIADTVLFFASPWARGVTGQKISVEGGLGLT